MAPDEDSPWVEEQRARQAERREWLVFWVVALVAVALMVTVALNKKEPAAEDTASPTATPTSTASPQPEQKDDALNTDLFPNPLVSVAEEEGSKFDVDKNHDNRITEAEAGAALKALDADRDGKMDGRETEKLRAAVRYTNARLLERLMDVDGDRAVSVPERWKALKASDADQDGSLSESEVRAFWTAFTKKSYEPHAWELLTGDSRALLKSVRAFMQSHAPEGAFEIDELPLKEKGLTVVALNQTSVIVKARMVVQDLDVPVQVDFFLTYASGHWNVLRCWVSQGPDYRCPNHPEVASPMPQRCPFDRAVMVRKARPPRDGDGVR